MKAFLQLFPIELKLFLREPVAIFFTLVFPFIPLLVFGTIFGNSDAMPGFRVIDIYVPAVLAMVIAYVGLMGIPIALSEYREQGVLKRFRVSPLRLSHLVTAHIGVQFLLLVVSGVLLTAVSRLLFNIKLVVDPVAIALTVLLCCVPIFTIGFAVVGLCKGPRTTLAAGGCVFFLMLFTSGSAIPRRQFPPWLREVTDYVPLSHVVDLMTGVWVNQPAPNQMTSILVLLGVSVAAFAVVILSFRWA